MAESTAFARRTHKGGCATARIPGGLSSGVTGVITADDLSTWVGAVANGPTRGMVDIDGTAEEIEITAVSGNTFTIPAGGRGLRGTSDATHGADVTIDIIHSPRDDDEANQLVNAILGISGLSAGDLLYLLSATTFQRLAKGTARQQLAMNAGATAPEWVASLQSLLTAAGDLIYASGANTPARLAKGSDGQVLTLAGGVPTWAASGAGIIAKSAQVRRSAVQSIADNTVVPVQWDAEVSDTYGFHDTVTNNPRLTLPAGVAGPATVEFNGKFASNATGRRDVGIYKNGSSVAFKRVHAVTAVDHYDSITYIDAAAIAGDYYEAVVVQTSGGALDFAGSGVVDGSFGITVFDS